VKQGQVYLVNGEPHLSRYVPNGCATQLWESHEKELLAESGAGCVAPETEVWVPGEGPVPIAEAGTRCLSLGGPTEMMRPFRKGKADIYRVTLASGRSIAVTLEHRFLSRSGWVYASGLELGMELLSGLPADARHSKGTPGDSLAGCLQFREFELSAQQSSAGFLVSPSALSFWDKVVRIQFERHGEYYDTYVPGGENYLANGVWNHNTGKTRSILEWAKWAMAAYPGIRIVFSRLTKKSMRDTILPEWEDVVLGRTHAAIHGTASRMNRDAYFDPNGSEVILHELQNPDRFLSAQYDAFIIFQAEEISNDEVYLKALTRLRNGVYPFPRAILDVNPGVESHWINVRAERRLCRQCYEGIELEVPAVIEMDEDGTCPSCHGELWRHQMQRLHYRHHHNPRWFDLEKMMWTPEGKEYVFITLGSLHGVQRERLLKHRWVAEEGIILEEWDPEIHYGGGTLYAPEQDPTEKDCPLWRFHTPDEEIFTFEWFGAGVDWGHTDPGVIQVWGVTAADEYVLIEEHIKCKMLIEYWAQLADALRLKYDIRFFACDPSRPDYIEAFNKRFSGSYEREGPCFAVKADNSLRAKPKAKAKDLVGVDLMREALCDNEGIHRVYVWADSPQRIDKERRRSGLPVSFKDEVLQWTWAKNADGKIIEKPDQDCEDHACFPAGTLVQTPRGPQAIETLAAGDEVVTPGGVRPIVAAGMTDDDSELWSLPTEAGDLVGTGNHPLWTSDGWRRLDSIRDGDHLAAWGGSGIPEDLAETMLRVSGISWPCTPGAPVHMWRATKSARRLKKRAAVYSLEVADHHVYFANGILVSNCDAFRYFLSIAWLRRFRDSERSRKYRVGSIAQVLGWQSRKKRTG